MTLLDPSAVDYEARFWHVDRLIQILEFTRRAGFLSLDTAITTKA
jgi:hypothetical protein